MDFFLSILAFLGAILMVSSLFYTLIYLKDKSSSDFTKKDKFFFSLCFSSLFSYTAFIMVITYLYTRGLVDYRKFHLLTPVTDPNFLLEWLFLTLLLLTSGIVLVRTTKQIGMVYVFISMAIAIFTLIYWNFSILMLYTKFSCSSPTIFKNSPLEILL